MLKRDEGKQSQVRKHTKPGDSNNPAQNTIPFLLGIAFVFSINMMKLKVDSTAGLKRA